MVFFFGYPWPLYFYKYFGISLACKYPQKYSLLLCDLSLELDIVLHVLVRLPLILIMVFVFSVGPYGLYAVFIPRF